MKKYLLTSILLLSFILTVHAQSNYSSGYIITNDQDTISGLIDYRTDKMNALTCHFKKDLTSPEQTYLPGQIFGYRFTDAGKFYISKFVTINGIQQKVFLEYLLQGIMNLYFYCDESDAEYLNYYFFENENGEMVCITKHPDKIIKEDDGNMRKLEDNKYQRIVSFIFKDINSLKYKALHANFTHKDMIGLTKDYHSLVCTSGAECIEFETTPDKFYIKTKFSVYAGFENKSLAPSILWDDYGVGYLLVNHAPFIGGEFSFSIPRWKKSVSLQTDLSLTQYQKEVKEYNYNYDGMRLALNVGAKYTYEKGRIRPCVEAGLIFNSGLNITESQGEYERKLELDPCMPGYYAAVGADYHLGNDHFILLRINAEMRQNFFWFKDYDMRTWKFKLGYTF